MRTVLDPDLVNRCLLWFYLNPLHTGPTPERCVWVLFPLSELPSIFTFVQINSFTWTIRGLEILK